MKNSAAPPTFACTLLFLFGFSKHYQHAWEVFYCSKTKIVRRSTWSHQFSIFLFWADGYPVFIDYHSFWYKASLCVMYVIHGANIYRGGAESRYFVFTATNRDIRRFSRQIAIFFGFPRWIALFALFRARSRLFRALTLKFLVFWGRFDQSF
jgi:hypothetical protein